MRWAPQDYRTSRVRARSAMTKDAMLRLVYLEALSALYEAGGSLPADPAALADELLLPAKEIARCLPILDEIARSGTGRGGLLVQDGRVTNGRVTADLKDEQEFRAQQAAFGRKRGRKGGGGGPVAPHINEEATLTGPEGSLDEPEGSLKEPQPAVSVSVSVPSAVSVSTTERTDGARPPVQARPNRDDLNGPRTNPLMAGRRPEFERRWHVAIRGLAELTGADPEVIAAKGQDYAGARGRKLNPASMSDDRLMNTVLDLEADLAEAEKRARGPTAVKGSAGSAGGSRGS
jgi:hypothetical protein